MHYFTWNLGEKGPGVSSTGWEIRTLDDGNIFFLGPKISPECGEGNLLKWVIFCLCGGADVCSSR